MRYRTWTVIAKEELRHNFKYFEVPEQLLCIFQLILVSS